MQNLFTTIDKIQDQVNRETKIKYVLKDNKGDIEKVLSDSKYANEVLLFVKKSSKTSEFTKRDHFPTEEEVLKEQINQSGRFVDVKLGGDDEKYESFEDFKKSIDLISRLDKKNFSSVLDALLYLKNFKPKNARYNLAERMIEFRNDMLREKEKDDLLIKRLNEVSKDDFDVYLIATDLEYNFGPSLVKKYLEGKTLSNNLKAKLNL